MNMPLIVCSLTVLGIIALVALLHLLVEMFDFGGMVIVVIFVCLCGLVGGIFN